MYLKRRKDKESGREYALRTLKENIISLELTPGSMVSENELAAEMGISRTPVREALLELSRVKVVEIYPQRGIGISLVDYDLVDEAYFLRITLETAVLKRCCLKSLSDRQKRDFEEILQLQKLYAETESRKRLELDNRFHRLLFKTAGLPNLFPLMDSMTIHLDRVRTMHLKAFKEWYAVEEHRGIYDAVLSGNYDKAAKLLSGHIAHYKSDDAVIRSKYKKLIKDNDKKENIS